MARKFDSIVETVGNTPVVRINRLAPPHVNLFVGPRSIRFTGGLATAVHDGAEVAILPAVSGG